MITEASLFSGLSIIDQVESITNRPGCQLVFMGFLEESCQIPAYFAVLQKKCQKESPIVLNHALFIKKVHLICGI